MVVTAQHVCCFSASVKRWQISNLNCILADFCRFPVVSTVIKKSLLPSSELGEGIKFMAPMEAAMKQTLHSFPLDKRSRSAPERVKTPTSTAPTRTGRPFNQAPTRTGPLHVWANAQKHRTPAKWLMSVATWKAMAFKSSVFDSSGRVSRYKSLPIRIMLPVCKPANWLKCTKVTKSMKPAVREKPRTSKQTLRWIAMVAAKQCVWPFPLKVIISKIWDQFEVTCSNIVVWKIKYVETKRCTLNKSYGRTSLRQTSFKKNKLMYEVFRLRTRMTKFQTSTPGTLKASLSSVA